MSTTTKKRSTKTRSSQGTFKTGPRDRFELSKLTFGTAYCDDFGQSVTADYEGRRIGHLELERRSEFGKTGEIISVFVHEDYRRLGIATALWNEAMRRHEADRFFLKPRHSAHRTDDGEGWARSFGIRLPKWQREDWSA